MAKVKGYGFKDWDIVAGKELKAKAWGTLAPIKTAQCTPDGMTTAIRETDNRSSAEMENYYTAPMEGLQRALRVALAENERLERELDAAQQALVAVQWKPK